MSSRVILTSTEMSSRPFRYICCIEGLSRRRAPVILGTGVLIGSCTVLTAAHVLVDPRSGQVANPRRIRVTPGRTGEDRPFGCSLADDIVINPEFDHLSPHGPDDFAVMQLASTFSPHPGFWGERPIPADDARGSGRGALSGWQPGRYRVNHCGYPRFNAGFATHWFSDTLPGLGNNLLTIASHAEKGESGSPVWVTRDRSLGGRHLWGIIVGGDGLVPNLPATETFAILLNRATGLDKRVSMVDFIRGRIRSRCSSAIQTVCR